MNYDVCQMWYNCDNMSRKVTKLYFVCLVELSVQFLSSSSLLIYVYFILKANAQGNRSGNRSGGRISTFFQNLAPNSRRPPSDGRSESLSPSDSVKTELLPPIDGINRSQLTSRNSSPSYSKNGSRLGVSEGHPDQASPCSDGCIHSKRSSRYE